MNTSKAPGNAWHTLRRTTTINNESQWLRANGNPTISLFPRPSEQPLMSASSRRKKPVNARLVKPVDFLELQALLEHCAGRQWEVKRSCYVQSSGDKAMLRRLSGPPCFQIYGKAQERKPIGTSSAFMRRTAATMNNAAGFSVWGTCITWTAEVIAVGWDFAEDVLREQVSEPASHNRSCGTGSRHPRPSSPRCRGSICFSPVPARCWLANAATHGRCFAWACCTGHRRNLHALPRRVALVESLREPGQRNRSVRRHRQRLGLYRNYVHN